PSSGRTSRHRAHPRPRRIRHCRRPDDRHAHGRVPAGTDEGRAARHRRRADHVSLPH
ncbi:MAG: hypothetical protein KDH19_00110, partial [Geminicoccaceae bacterium]|nr:hypothetical protein [Geminicoccaceae bacterium]